MSKIKLWTALFLLYSAAGYSGGYPISSENGDYYLLIDETGAAKVTGDLTVTFPDTLSTSAKQDTGNTSLASLDTKLSALIAALGSPFQVGGSISNTAFNINNFPSTYAVTGSFYQATQPVSIASMPSTPVTGTFWQATQPVSGSFYQATQPVSIASMPSTPVTGTFYQATQPVSLASAPTTPVTGTFWQATQPVSGTFYQATQPVSIASMPSTPVTGTFWQATQPVSLASAPTTPVTGTFWQATQPISASSLPLPSGAATDVAQASTTSGQTGALVQGAVTTAAPSYTTAKTNPLSLNPSGGLRVDGSGVTQPVSGTFYQATQPVSLASAPTTPVTGTFWQATQPVSIASMPSTPVTGTFWQATQPVSLASAPTTPVTMAASSITGSNPCINPTATVTSINGATSGTNAAQIIALSGSTKVYICSMNITGVSGTSPTFSLVYGTGSNCATGQTVLLGAWTTAASTIYNFTGPTVAIGAAGNAICYKDGGTSPVQNYNIVYVQQ